MTERDVWDSIADHAVRHARGTYRISLVRVQPDPGGLDAFDLFLRATPQGGGDPLAFKLHMSKGNATDRAYLRAVIDDTIVAILDGRLAPGAIHFL